MAHRRAQVWLALRAHGSGEARHTRFGECAQELVEGPGGNQVGGLLFERGVDGFGVEVVEVEQNVVGVDRFDAETGSQASGGKSSRSKVMISSESEATAAARTCRSLGSVGHRRLEPIDLSAVDFDFLEKAARIAASIRAVRRHESDRICLYLYRQVLLDAEVWPFRFGPPLEPVFLRSARSSRTRVGSHNSIRSQTA